MATIFPVIPTNITVHLGAPSSSAQNVTVPFPDYIKNVASSEIYPTWETAAIYANIYAQISFALNRVYTEFYRSKGYNFDITSSTAFDQNFIYDRNIFENISQIVDDIFDNYIRRIGFIEPLAAKYCNGTSVTCEGLSQWGSQRLAQQGYDFFSILTNYYGSSIELVYNAPIKDVSSSYPGYPLSVGSYGPDVVVVQASLNLISQNYPSIPKLKSVDGIFGPETENAVKIFQQIFNLTPDGIVGKATWYKLVELYVGIKKLSELDSKGQTIYRNILGGPITSADDRTTRIQYMLALIARFNPFIPPITITGVYNSETRNAVKSYQEYSGLAQTGITDELTYDYLFDSVRGIEDAVSSSTEFNGSTYLPYMGGTLKLGNRGEYVYELNKYLYVISGCYPEISIKTISNLYTEETKRAVMNFQRIFKLPVTGEVNENTWNKIGEEFIICETKSNQNSNQYSGTPLKSGDFDTESLNKDKKGSYPVEALQEMLRQISFENGDELNIKPTGVFDLPTENAVKEIQKRNGMKPSGIVDFDTFNIIRKEQKEAVNNLTPKRKVSVLAGIDVINPDDSHKCMLVINAMLKTIESNYSNLTEITVVTDIHNSESIALIKELQGLSGFSKTGTINKEIYNIISLLYEALTIGYITK